MEAFNVGFFGAQAVTGPFGNNSQAPPKTPGLQTPPKFTTNAKARRPLSVEPWKVGVQRTFARSKHVRPLASEHFAHQAPAMAGVAHDLLDRGSDFGLGEDGGVRFFPTRGGSSPQRSFSYELLDRRPNPQWGFKRSHH